MGKTRDLFKKIRDTKGTFHAKMGTSLCRKGGVMSEVIDISPGSLASSLCSLQPGVSRGVLWV